jgi:Macrocin-O-methyltransferase (TylF)
MRAQQLKDPVKYRLTKLGARCPEMLTHSLQSFVNYLEVGRWMNAHGYRTDRRFRYRTDLFDLAAQGIAGQQVLYLEFGVAEGESLRYWSGLLRHPHAHLHGFDSFEGLPSNWSATHKKGTFSTGGRMPVFDDQRVKLFKGWFEDTIPGYEPPGHEVLFVNIDADLYTSTAVALTGIQEMIKPGDFLYFDEFAQVFDELRAFDELIDRTGMQFEFVGATRDLVHVLFRRAASS